MSNRSKALAAVSYTHLDVYKRQGLKNPIITPINATTTKINIVTTGDTFFFDINHQQKITKAAVKNPGYTPSN